MSDAWAQAETERILANMIRLGAVSELDEANARVRVKVGGLTTDWLPWLTARAGATRTWSAPRPGEQVAATASKAYQSVQDAIGPYASQLNDAAGAALRVVEAANGLQLAAVQTGTAVARTPLAAIALSSSQTLGSKAAGYQQMASSAGNLLRGSVGKLEALANVPQATIQSVRVAAACAEKTATLCRQTTGEVAKITGVAAA